MGANLSKTFVVDVEATCWSTDTDLHGDEQQNGQPNEIIEIGIVALSLKDGGIIQKASYPCKPRFTKVSRFCTELTGWTQQAVDRAPDIEDVLSSIRNDFGITRHHTWWSGGEYDRYKLSSAPHLNGSLGSLYNLKVQTWNPFHEMRAHYNIKTLLAMRMRWPRERGLAESLKALGLTLDGRHHNGADDAENTAKLVRHLLNLC